MIRAPNTYSPALDPTRAKERRDLVLGRMQELGTITAEQDGDGATRAGKSRARALVGPGRALLQRPRAPTARGRPRGRRSRRRRCGAHLHDARRAAPTLRGDRDRTRHRAPRARLPEASPRRRRPEHPSRARGARSRLRRRARARRRPRLRTAPFDRVPLAHRQPGSTFKPFVFFAAFEPTSGRGRRSRSRRSSRTSRSRSQVGNKSWSRQLRRPLRRARDVRRALERSLNAATVRVAENVGLDSGGATAARRLGVTSELPPFRPWRSAPPR